MSAFNKRFVCLANEGTGAAFSSRLRQGYAETSREWIEDSSRGERYKRLFVAFGAFHFAPKEDVYDGSYGSPILDVLKEGIEFGRCHSDDG